MSLVPKGLRNLREAGQLLVEWQRPKRHSHAQLREACPCSQCRASRLRGQSPSFPADLRLQRLVLQGYGVQMIFSDGHDRGIYPWEYLHALPEASDSAAQRTIG